MITSALEKREQARLKQPCFSSLLFGYSGASLGYQFASITAGGPAPIIATYLVANSKILIGPTAPSYTLIACFIIFMSVVSFISTALLREYAGKAAAEDVPEAVAVSGD